MASSSSPARMLRASGSKVITDPVQLGPDLLQFSLDGGALGHVWIVASAFPDVLEADQGELLACDELTLDVLGDGLARLPKEVRLPRERAASETGVQLAQHRL